MLCCVAQILCLYNDTESSSSCANIFSGQERCCGAAAAKDSGVSHETRKGQERSSVKADLSQLSASPTDIQGPETSFEGHKNANLLPVGLQLLFSAT